MPHTRPAPFLHVANGTCTTEVIEAAAIPGLVSIWADPLHDGPVPDSLTDDELIDRRARYLAGPADVSYPGALDELTRWRQIIADHRAYEELVLWFEHDLFNQLNLIQLLSWIRGRLPPGKPVSLVCIGSFPGRPGFKGLGELRPTELAPLLDTRQRVTEEQFALAERAWRAFREPTPAALDDLRRADTAALPYLASAATRFLQEYPWTRDGLSRSERRLLEIAAAGRVELAAAFARMHDGEDAFHITDSSLASLVNELSGTSPPLVSHARGQLPAGQTLEGSVRTTDAGRAVLAGRQDRVTTCGIDRWLGGVHLHGHAEPWRWDDQRQRITRS